jgi:cytochrome oxidase Cu insertion factor (SCO1/SenC/PrrC family)
VLPARAARATLRVHLAPAYALAVALALVGCAARPGSAGVRGHAAQQGSSLFARPWVWTDELGEKASFAQWRGSPVVVTTIYTTCVRTCPRTVTDLEKLADAFRREGREAQFVLVTLDPTTDTPARLREFKERRGLHVMDAGDGVGAWSFANGDLDGESRVALAHF